VEKGNVSDRKLFRYEASPAMQRIGGSGSAAPESFKEIWQGACLIEASRHIAVHFRDEPAGCGWMEVEAQSSWAAFVADSMEKIAKLPWNADGPLQQWACSYLVFKGK